MSKDRVKNIIEDNFKMPRTLDLYKEFIGKTQIEIYKEEDFVIHSLMKGDPKIKIINTLKDKYPEGKFSYDDIDKFIERSDELHKVLKIDKGSLYKRWLKAKTNCMEELAQLAVYTKGLIPKLQEQRDNTNTLKAVQTMQGLILNMMELEGTRNSSGPQINTQVNIDAGKVDQIRQRLRAKAHHADFVVENDEVPTEQKERPENESSDS